MRAGAAACPQDARFYAMKTRRRPTRNSRSASTQVMTQVDEMQGDDNIRTARKALVQGLNAQLDR